MPLKENRVADPEVKRMRCWKCDGILSPETAIDLDSGVPVERLLCLNCGRQDRLLPPDDPRCK